MAIIEFVSQHEKIPTRAPHFCVAYQAPHAVAGDETHAVAAEAPHAVAADGTHAVAADGTHEVAGDGSHAVTADRCTLICDGRRPRARTSANGSAPHTGGEKKLQSFNAPSRDSPALP
jgi:hypothetical protein